MKTCLFCQNPLTYNFTVQEIFLFKPIYTENMCQLCRSQLEKLNEKNCCIRCFKPGIRTICSDCRFWESKYNLINCHQSLYRYNQFIHNYFKLYKRYGDMLLADLFSKDLHNWANSHRFDLITYIPASPSHLKQRGFDPVFELYKNIFDLTPLLKKVDADMPQAQKNRQQRLQTPQTFSYQPTKEISRDVKLLIVDDIYTTGRTILHARNVLEQAGFHNICTFSLSR